MKQGPEASPSKNSTATRTQKILTSNSTFPQPRLFVDRLSGAWSLDFRGSTPRRISRMEKEVKLEKEKKGGEAEKRNNGQEVKIHYTLEAWIGRS